MKSCPLGTYKIHSISCTAWKVHDHWQKQKKLMISCNLTFSLFSHPHQPSQCMKCVVRFSHLFLSLYLLNLLFPFHLLTTFIQALITLHLKLWFWSNWFWKILFSQMAFYSFFLLLSIHHLSFYRLCLSTTFPITKSIHHIFGKWCHVFLSVTEIFYLQCLWWLE